jgi:hypothetical protein
LGSDAMAEALRDDEKVFDAVCDMRFVTLHPEQQPTDRC